MLKKSANEGFAVRDVAANVKATFVEYEPKATDDSLRDVVNDIKLNKFKRMELYAILGVEFANVKYSYMKIKCGKCLTINDIYKVINCMKCVKTNNIRGYFQRMKQVTGYSKDYVIFFINIGHLCKQYPKMLYATVSTYDLKKHMAYVVVKMKDDVDFWSV